MSTVEKDKYIEELASLQFSIQEISLIVEISEKEILKKYIKNIDKGRLMAEAIVRKSILMEAREGNIQAQKKFMELNESAKKADKQCKRSNKADA